jgi:hypothetical protein
MPNKTFPVATYILSAGFKNTSGWGGVTIQSQGSLTCRGADGSTLIVYGLHPSSPVPATPVYNISANVGAIFVAFGDLPNYVDIVRNEKPVYARLDSDQPNWMGLSTNWEAVGEQEAVVVG